MGQRILALELAGDHVRAAVAERTWNAMQMRGVFEQRRNTDEPDQSAAIARIIEAAGKPDIVVSALPGEYVAKRLLTLPFGDRRRLQQIVPFELEEHLPFAVDSAAIAFARVGRDGSNTLVLAASARKDDLRHHLELLAKAGLDPKTVTLSTLALAGMLGRTGNGGRGPHLILDIDHSYTSMVLLDAAGTPRAMRTVGTGLESRNGNPLPPATAAAILSAVRQTLLAHSTDHEHPDLVLTGPAAGAPSIRAQLAQALEVPVRGAEEFDYAAALPGLKKEPVRFAACIAMLLAESPGKPLELVNFRQGEFAFHGRTGQLGPLYHSAILGAAAAAFIVIHLMLGIATNLHQLGLLNREIEATTASALGSTSGAEARDELKERIIAMRKRLRLLGGGPGLSSPLDILLAVSEAIPPGLAAQFSDLTIDDSGIKLDGSADSFATVDEVKKSLERSNDFDAIEVEHAGAGSDPSKVEFRLSASLIDSGME